jgi:hypothetical protein
MSSLWPLIVLVTLPLALLWLIDLIAMLLH